MLSKSPSMDALITYTKDGQDEASGCEYHITLTPSSEATNSGNPNIHGLSIDSMIADDFFYDTYMTSYYNIRLSSVIQQAHRLVLTGFLHDRDVPLAACNDTVSLILQAYGLGDSPSCLQVKNIQARVRIELTYKYFEMPVEDSLRPTPARRDVVEALEKVVVRVAEDGQVKISLRSDDEVDTMPFSEKFGGTLVRSFILSTHEFESWKI